MKSIRLGTLSKDASAGKKETSLVREDIVKRLSSLVSSKEIKVKVINFLCKCAISSTHLMSSVFIG
ncbi:MAG: hypothetical protein ACI86M_002394 [Saprospiraceae bacterium]|jgi:hypothetical protein